MMPEHLVKAVMPSPAEQHRMIIKWKRDSLSGNLKIQTEAEKVILDKIKHFEKTGNVRKLAIYKLKLADKRSIISILKGVIKNG